MPTFHISSGHKRGKEIKTIVRNLLKPEAIGVGNTESLFTRII